jgi:hypothetical protein
VSQSPTPDPALLGVVACDFRARPAGAPTFDQLLSLAPQGAQRRRLLFPRAEVDALVDGRPAVERALTLVPELGPAECVRLARAALARCAELE